MPRIRPRRAAVTDGFDLSGCCDCTACPPLAPAETNNTTPSAIVLHGIRMRGVYKCPRDDGDGAWRFSRGDGLTDAQRDISGRWPAVAPPGCVEHHRGCSGGLCDPGVFGTMSVW